MAQPLWRTVQRFLENLNIELPYDPATSLLGIHPRGRKTNICTKLVHGCSQQPESQEPTDGNNSNVHRLISE